MGDLQKHRSGARFGSSRRQQLDVFKFTARLPKARMRWSNLAGPTKCAELTVYIDIYTASKFRGERGGLVSAVDTLPTVLK